MKNLGTTLKVAIGRRRKSVETPRLVGQRCGVQIAGWKPDRWMFGCCRSQGEDSYVRQTPKFTPTRGRLLGAFLVGSETRCNAIEIVY